MSLGALVAASIILWIMLIPFTSYCIVDSDQPTAPVGQHTFFVTQGLLTVTGVSALYLYHTQSEYTLLTTMLFVGMLFAAASVDPNHIKRTNGESLWAYLWRFTVERLRRAAVYKVAVYCAAAVATYFFPNYWYVVMLCVVTQLHYYKMAGCIVAEAGTRAPQDAPREIRRKWARRAILAMVVLVLLVKSVQAVFVEKQYVPDAWGAFGGFSLMSAGLFLVSLLTRSDS